MGGEDGEARVRVLTWDIALRSWARHETLTVPLSTQGTSEFNTEGVQHTPSRFMLLAME